MVFSCRESEMSRQNKKNYYMLYNVMFYKYWSRSTGFVSVVKLKQTNKNSLQQTKIIEQMV